MTGLNSVWTVRPMWLVELTRRGSTCLWRNRHSHFNSHLSSPDLEIHRGDGTSSPNDQRRHHQNSRPIQKPTSTAVPTTTQPEPHNGGFVTCFDLRVRGGAGRFPIFTEGGSPYSLGRVTLRRQPSRAVSSRAQSLGSRSAVVSGRWHNDGHCLTQTLTELVRERHVCGACASFRGRRVDIR